MTVRVIVVDDEELGRRGVTSRLERRSEIEVVATCGNGRDAIRAIESLRPDIVFLDVQMPGLDGFGVLEALPVASRPHVVFITAFEQHAVRAFDVHAAGYLLKPIDDDRFTAAVDRALGALALERDGDFGRRVAAVLGDVFATPGSPSALRDERFVVRSGSKVRHVAHADVDWIEAAGDYVRIHAGSTAPLLRDSLTAVAARIDPARFIRIHRATIVNVDRIRELVSLDNGDYTVRLHDGTELRLSRSYREAVDRLTRSR